MTIRSLSSLGLTSAHAWETLQVELHGSYSSDRLTRLREFTNATSRLKLTALILLTPLPCLFAVILADVAPLNPPEAGTNANVVHWLRSLLVVWVFTLSFVVQFREMLPTLPMSPIRSFNITAVVSVCVICWCYSLSLAIGFPVPFLMVLGAPVWATLLLSSFAVSWRRQIRESEEVQAQVLDGLKVFVIQMSMIVVYPFYNFGFTQLSSVAQAAFSLLLQVIKLTIKNLISRYVRAQADMKPEVVIFNVEVFNALFVSFCMQNSTSMLTVAAIMAADMTHMAISLREVMLMLRELKKIEDQLDLIEALAIGGLPTTKKALSKTYRNALDRACAIMAQRKPSGDQVASESSRQSTVNSTIQAGNGYFLARSSKIYPNESGNSPTIVSDLPRKDQEKRGPESVHSGNERWADKSPAAPDPSKSLERLEDVYVHKVTQLLHLAEFTILIEYTEVIVPVVYSIYVIAMSYLPNRIYYPQLANMDTDGLRKTLSNVLLYGLLEFLSILVLDYVLRKSMRYSPVCQLAFVLQTQWKMVQSKLVLWVLYVVQSSLVHFGADYSFQFAWLQATPTQ